MSHPNPDHPRSAKSGIQTTSDGDSYIPSSKRADGSTRKEIKVRPGYKPPEDVETYKNRSAEAWKTRGKGGIPGADTGSLVKEDGPSKSKNAKRREAAKRKLADGSTETGDDDLTSAMQKTEISGPNERTKTWHDPSKLATNNQAVTDVDAEQQKKIRNQLKKLRAVHELKEKKAAGEKMSPDQIMKIGKEGELLRDLRKLGYDGPETQADGVESASEATQATKGAG